MNQEAIAAAVEAALQKQRRLRKTAVSDDEDQDQDDDSRDSRASTNASSGMLGRFFRGGR